MAASNSGTASTATLMRSWRRRVFVSTWVAYAGMYFGRKAFSIVKKPLGDDLSLDVTQLGA